MSMLLHQEALLWNGHVGLAKCNGVSIELTAWPAAAVPGHVVDLKFIPGIRECEVRMSAGGWRPMTEVEKAAAHTFLKRVAAATYTEINR